MAKVIIIIIIVLLIIWLFYCTQNTNVSEPYCNNIKEKSIIFSDTDIIPESNKKYIIKKPKHKCIVKQKTNNVLENDIVEGHVEICPRPPQTIKQFNTDFFNFRDKIELNTSIQQDTVDKITDLFLDGTIWKVPDGQTKPIGELYDELTKRPDFSKDCTRIPTFDSVMYDGYNPQNVTVTGLYNNGEEWVYKNEYDMNGW